MSCTLCSAKKGFEGLGCRDLRGEVALVTQRIGMVSQVKCRQRRGERKWKGGWAWELRQKRRKQVQHLCCLPHAFILGLSSSSSRLPPWKTGDGFSSCVASEGVSAALLSSKLLVYPAACLSPFARCMSLLDLNCT